MSNPAPSNPITFIKIGIIPATEVTTAQLEAYRDAFEKTQLDPAGAIISNATPVWTGEEEDGDTHE